MAEGIFNDLCHKYGLKLKAKSAGIFADEGTPVSIKSVEALKELNIDISSYNSKSIETIDLEKIDLVLVMGKNHKRLLIEKYPHIVDRIFLLNEYAFDEKKDIEDPFGGDLEVYRLARDQIYRGITEIIRREKDDNRHR